MRFSDTGKPTLCWLEASVHIVSHSDPTVVSSEISNHIDLLSTVYFKPIGFAETLATRAMGCVVPFKLSKQLAKHVFLYIKQHFTDLYGEFPTYTQKLRF